ncbi:sialate:O-sulfotransferase 2-like isoform X2 [Asterias amurensis]|uniref:sialate:O-sulfotransferase 2-like isoform X2 n=1 Tax=Asterias amurensis TaxID=7602 RepID=UPI003AB728B4
MTFCRTYKTTCRFLNLPVRLLVLVVLVVGGYHIAKSWNRIEKGTNVSKQEVQQDGDGQHRQVPEIPQHPASLPDTKEKFISALNKTWMTWTTIDSPGVYRACVPRPKDVLTAHDIVTAGLVKESTNMTIGLCLQTCISLHLTYAALSRGSQCFCSDVKAESVLLNYMESALCDKPCSGDPKYNCGGMEFMSLYRTSVPDLRCSKVELKAKNSLPFIALASYPRSGNTWTRSLIEKGTGIPTGSVYWKGESKMQISKKVFIGGNIDFKTKQTICIKSHMSDTSHVKEFEGAVLLLRNPYSAIVAEIFRRLMIEKKIAHDEAIKQFQSAEWTKFAKEQTAQWKTMALQWITHSKRIHVAHYEDLQQHTSEELTKIVQFLNVPVDKQRVLCAVQEHPSSKTTGIALGNHGLKTRVYLTKDPFPNEVRKLIDDNIKEVNSTLIKYNLTPLPMDYSVKVF